MILLILYLLVFTICKIICDCVIKCINIEPRYPAVLMLVTAETPHTPEDVRTQVREIYRELGLLLEEIIEEASGPRRQEDALARGF